MLCFCRLSCDRKVISELRPRTLGNSANRLWTSLRERHIEAWMEQSVRYYSVCEQFLALCSLRGPFPPAPAMPPLPSPVWLLTVYGYDVLTRLEEYKARITSIFGSILKMDSTKKASGVCGSSIFSYSCFFKAQPCVCQRAYNKITYSLFLFR